MGYDNKIESIKMLIREAAWSAKDCHEILFRSDDNLANEKDELIAAIHLNKAISLMASAKAVYISDYENLSHSEVENIFAEFSLFEDEFLTDLKSNHSHQHTDFKYHDFKSAYELLFGKL